MQIRYMELNRQTGLPTGGYFEGKELQNGNSIYSWKNNGLIVVSFAIREEVSVTGNSTRTSEKVDFI